MVGYLAHGDGDLKRPGVLVAHESPGRTEHVHSAADRLAALGYVAFAVDYQGEGQVVSDRDEMMRRYAAFMADPTGIRLRMAAALQVLRGHPLVDTGRMAAIGYCYGGTASLELARAGAELKAVVGFHSGLGTARPQDAAAIRAKVLVCVGSADPVIPPEQRAAFEAEMTAAGVDWRLNLYGGAGHSFTNPAIDAMGMPGFRYDASADRRSWRAMLDLFDEVF
jgi:dienelactone hydrolase